MKEQCIPTKDLKTGAKVIGVVTKSVFESLKPELKRRVGKELREALVSIRRNKFS